MRERILNDLKQAMKIQDKETLSVIRAIKGAMQLEEINKKHELTDEEMIDVIAKQVKTRRESLVEFEKGNRQDLIDQTQREIDLLSIYLPEQLSEEEIIKIIEETFNLVNPTAKSDMGKVMKELTVQLKGKADMKWVSEMVKERLDCKEK